MAARHRITAQSSRGPRLARFNGGTVEYPALFGGGFQAACATSRILTVVHGYPSVLEEFAEPECGVRWCVMTLSLSGQVPNLSVDHRDALGRPGVPTSDFADMTGGTGSADFDQTYRVTAAEPTMIADLVTEQLREVLLGVRLQRVEFSGSRLLLRTFDRTPTSPGVMERLSADAIAILETTPAFESIFHPGQLQLFPRGVRGLAD